MVQLAKVGLCLDLAAVFCRLRVVSGSSGNLGLPQKRPQRFVSKRPIHNVGDALIGLACGALFGIRLHIWWYWITTATGHAALGLAGLVVQNTLKALGYGGLTSEAQPCNAKTNNDHGALIVKHGGGGEGHREDGMAGPHTDWGFWML